MAYWTHSTRDWATSKIKGTPKQYRGTEETTVDIGRLDQLGGHDSTSESACTVPGPRHWSRQSDSAIGKNWLSTPVLFLICCQNILCEKGLSWEQFSPITKSARMELSNQLHTWYLLVSVYLMKVAQAPQRCFHLFWLMRSLLNWNKREQSQEQTFFTADVLSCQSRESTGVFNSINNGCISLFWSSWYCVLALWLPYWDTFWTEPSLILVILPMLFLQ